MKLQIEIDTLLDEAEHAHFLASKSSPKYIATWESLIQSFLAKETETFRMRKDHLAQLVRRQAEEEAAKAAEEAQLDERIRLVAASEVFRILDKGESQQ